MWARDTSLAAFLHSVSGETCRFTFFSWTKPNESKMNKAESRILSFFASSETRKENHWWSCNESQSLHSLRISLSAAIRTCLKHCCWQNSWYSPTDSDCSDESVWGGGGRGCSHWVICFSVLNSIFTSINNTVWVIVRGAFQTLNSTSSALLWWWSQADGLPLCP